MEKYSNVGTPTLPSSYQSTLNVTSNICCISLSRYDSLRRIGAPPRLKSSFCEMLQRCWSPGIQDERDYYGHPVFKLRGNPWLGQGNEAVSGRILMVRILRLMEQYGWRHLASIDISKKSCDKDSLFFEFTGIICNPIIFSISLNQTARLRIIEGPSDVPELVRNSIQGFWKIQDERRYDFSFEFKLLGNPWMAQGSDTVQVRILLMRLLSCLRSTGYRLYATVDMNTGNDGRDLNSWFFRRED